MAKRDKDVITLGSGKIYVTVFSETLPSTADLC